MRESKSPSRKKILQVATGLLLLGLGAIWLTDRPGLSLEYYAGVGEPLPSPVFREIGLPQVDGRKQVSSVLVSQEIFSLRWRGWLWVETAGDYHFVVTGDEASFVELDGQLVARTSKSHRSVTSSPVSLEEGPHPIALGLTQTGGRARFGVTWGRVDSRSQEFEVRSLFARSPVRMRRLLRSVPLLPDSEGLTLVLGAVISLVGCGLCATGFGGIRNQFQRLGSWGNRWHQVLWRRRAAHALFLLAIFLICSYSIFPLTASTADGDDVRYMDAARFNKQMGWNMNRYAHIYGLKAFIWATDGDAFQASRLHWAFLFGVTVVALAIAVRSLGSGLQLQTLIVALFLL